MSAIPDFCPTPVDEIPSMVSTCRESFRRGVLETIEQRRTVLRALAKMVDEHRAELANAVQADVGRTVMETEIMETTGILNGIYYLLDHLKEYMSPEKPHMEGMLSLVDCKVNRDPLGVVLIIGAWNYPVELALSPMCGALAAGNTVVLKPSEVSPASASIIARLLPKYVSSDIVCVVNGGADVCTEVLKERFDSILYTGNSTVGKIVMAAAAKHLTPVTLELGGKCPTIVDPSCKKSMDMVVARILWGKYANSGQTCAAPDYLLIHESVKDDFINTFRAKRAEFMGSETDPLSDPHFGRIVNDRHFARVKALLESGGRVVVGGEMDESRLKIAPTLIDVEDVSCALMTDEVFGPLLPMVTYKEPEDVIRFVCDREKPLALYIFSNDASFIKLITHKTSSGAVHINDVMTHFCMTGLPFGGVGHSGMGHWKGKYTFETFSHRKSVINEALNMEETRIMRYPPYTESKLDWNNQMMAQKGESSSCGIC